MTYKKLFLTLPVVLGAMALTTSCSFEQDEYFDESASLRVTHQNENVKNRLTEQSAADKNGWVLQYFVAGTDDYNFEGFNLFARFYDSGKVTLASDHKFLRNGNANKYTEHTSTYQMLSEEGSVLAFNTWNDILTVFVDPVDPSKAPGQLINNGEGMYGDMNLVLKKFTDNDIQLYGERHGAVSRLVPCDRPWQQYIADTKEMKNRIATSTLSNYYVINGVDTMYFKELNKGLFTYCERINDPLQKKTFMCVFTPKGFRMERPEVLGESSFQEFTIDNDTTCLTNEDGKVKVVACWDTYLASHTAIWELDTTMFTDTQKALYAELDQMLYKFNKGWSLKAIGFGKSTGGNSLNGLVLNCYTNTTKSKTNTLGMEVLQSRVAYGKVAIQPTTTVKTDNNMNAVEKKVPGFIAKVQEFVETLYGTYNVTPNDYFLPTGGLYTAAEGGNTFKLQ